MLKILILPFFLFFHSSRAEYFSDLLGDEFLEEFSAISDLSKGFWIHDEFVNKNTTQILAIIGFESEVHPVTTEDGYILQMIRIVNPWILDRSSIRPVLLLHGLSSNSAYLLTSEYSPKLRPDGILYNVKGDPTSCTVTSGANYSASFVLMLAACGYDVWLGNFRGNYYSDKHIKLNQSDPEYFLYSLDDLSDYDLPAMLDYVLVNTGEASLGFIGHSLGTTIMFQLMASRPEYQSKVDTYLAFGPMAQMNRRVNPLVALFATLYGLPGYPIIPPVSINPFLLPAKELSALRQRTVGVICNWKPLAPVCLLVFYIMMGFGQTNPLLVAQGYGHFPDPFSPMILQHYLQRVNSNYTVYRFDYGSVENTRIYGEPVPPAYDIASIEHRKIVLIAATEDPIAPPDNVHYLTRSLKYLNTKYVIDGYNHNDFLLGRDADVRVTKWLIGTMQRLYPK